MLHMDLRARSGIKSLSGTILSMKHRLYDLSHGLNNGIQPLPKKSLLLFCRLAYLGRLRLQGYTLDGQ